MTLVSYPQPVWEHATQTCHRGPLPQPDAMGECRHPPTGHDLRLYLKLSGDVICAASYETARASVPLRAAASLGCTLLHGMTRAQACRLTAVTLHQNLGGLLPSHRYALLMFIDCLQQALAHLPSPLRTLDASDFLARSPMSEEFKKNVPAPDQFG